MRFTDRNIFILMISLPYFFWWVNPDDHTLAIINVIVCVILEFCLIIALMFSLIKAHEKAHARKECDND